MTIHLLQSVCENAAKASQAVARQVKESIPLSYFLPNVPHSDKEYSTREETYVWDQPLASSVAIWDSPFKCTQCNTQSNQSLPVLYQPKPYDHETKGSGHP